MSVMFNQNIKYSNYVFLLYNCNYETLYLQQLEVQLVSCLILKYD